VTIDDPFQAGAAGSPDPRRALDLLEQQASALAAAAAPQKIDYRGDERRYRAQGKELDAILGRLGIRSPFPWATLAECLAYGKTEFPENLPGAPRGHLRAQGPGGRAAAAPYR
jgi:hypothetical protein